jgi:NAD(P)-dependent dehydrogenase (short-subunit alcohol dehydrogenase family)
VLTEAEAPVAVITGATSGIGLATAERLVADGFRVAICGRSRERLDHALARIAGSSGTAIGVAIDVRDEDSARQIVGAAVQAWHRIDVLVNNAGGISEVGAFEDLRDNDWRDALELNLLSAVRLVREGLPHFPATGGRIINVSSFVAKQPGDWNPHYSAAKAALLNFTKHLANRYADRGILVNSVSPGNIRTDGWISLLLERAEEFGLEPSTAIADEEERIATKVPLERMGTAGEVAECIAFLASPQSSYVTGTNILIDGGRIRAL